MKQCGWPRLLARTTSRPAVWSGERMGAMSHNVVVCTPSREKVAARGCAMLRITGSAAVALAVLVCAQGAIAKGQQRRTENRHAIPSFARASGRR
jgi:hypothetical protein